PVPPIDSDLFQCGREVWVAKNLSDLRSFSIRQKNWSEARLAGKGRSILFPIFCICFSDGHALVRERDCRSKILRKRYLSETIMKRSPSRNCARNGDRIDTG